MVLAMLLAAGCVHTPPRGPTEAPAMQVQGAELFTALRDLLLESALEAKRGVAIELVSADGQVRMVHVGATVAILQADGTSSIGYEHYEGPRDAATAWLEVSLDLSMHLPGTMPLAYPTPGTVSLYSFGTGELRSGNFAISELADAAHPLHDVFTAGVALAESCRAVDSEHLPFALIRVMADPRAQMARAPTPEPMASPPEPPPDHHPALLEPRLANETAPEAFRVRFETTRGSFVVEVHRSWAPLGVDRFYNLVRIGFYDQASFFRTVDGFITQWGISAYPSVSRVWREAPIMDDPVAQSNTRGRIAFASSGPDTRTSQLFINYADTNHALDELGFAPFGEVVEGMEVVDALHKTGEGKPNGPGPTQARVQGEGDGYLQVEYPEIDRILTVEIVP